MCELVSRPAEHQRPAGNQWDRAAEREAPLRQWTKHRPFSSRTWKKTQSGRPSRGDETVQTKRWFHRFLVHQRDWYMMISQYKSYVHKEFQKLNQKKRISNLATETLRDSVLKRLIVPTIYHPEVDGIYLDTNRPFQDSSNIWYKYDYFVYFERLWGSLRITALICGGLQVGYLFSFVFISGNPTNVVPGCLAILTPALSKNVKAVVNWVDSFSSRLSWPVTFRRVDLSSHEQSWRFQEGNTYSMPHI